MTACVLLAVTRGRAPRSIGSARGARDRARVRDPARSDSATCPSRQRELSADEHVVAHLIVLRVHGHAEARHRAKIEAGGLRVVAERREHRSPDRLCRPSSELLWICRCSPMKRVIWNSRQSPNTPSPMSGTEMFDGVVALDQVPVELPRIGGTRDALAAARSAASTSGRRSACACRAVAPRACGSSTRAGSCTRDAGRRVPARRSGAAAARRSAARCTRRGRARARAGCAAPRSTFHVPCASTRMSTSGGTASRMRATSSTWSSGS